MGEGIISFVHEWVRSHPYPLSSKGLAALADQIDAALTQARRETVERCANEVRANAGKCVSDASCEALANAILALEVE